jgi:hypothetical protein
MMRKFKFFEGIIDNSWIFHAGFPQAVPVSINERTTHVASIRNETVDDLSYYHGIDAEDELTRILLNEITTELTENWNGGHRA